MLVQVQIAEIDLGDYTEVLYKPALNAYDPDLTTDQLEYGWMFRVGNPHGIQVKAFLQKQLRRYTSQEIVDYRLFEERQNEIWKDPVPKKKKLSTKKHILRRQELDERWISTLRYKTTKYLIEPVPKQIGYNRFEIYLRVVDLNSGKNGQRLILESFHLDAFFLFKKIQLKGGVIKVLHHPTSATFYMDRGFASPTEIPIDLILNGVPEQR